MKTVGTIIIAIFFTVNLALAQDTLYVYKAGAVVYKSAVNSIDSVTFYKKYNTTSIPTTVTDADGNIYHTVTIGTQVWMVENLKTTKYNDGTLIQNVTGDADWYHLTSALTAAAYCWYNNNADYYKNIYGALYNWYAVNTGKLAPAGWHVATDAEWTTLANYVSGHLGASYSLAQALAATNNWGISANEGAIGNDFSKNNSSGFSALPGGYRYTDGFYVAYYDGFWWSSSNDGAYYAWFRYLHNNSGLLFRESCDKYAGYSVRCVKD